jgi:hypothetical protein
MTDISRLSSTDVFQNRIDREKYRHLMQNQIVIAEKSLQKKGLRQTLSRFEGLDQYPDLFKYCDEDALTNVVERGEIWLGRHGYYRDRWEKNPDDPAGDPLETRLRVRNEIDHASFGPTSPRPGYVPYGLHVEMTNTTVQTINDSTENYYLFCHSLPESAAAKKKYGRDSFGYRVRHYPIFVAAVNLELKKDKPRRMCRGRPKWIGAGPVKYIPREHLETEMPITSTTDPIADLDAVWFKEDGLVAENEGRLVWKAPDACDVDHIKIRSETIRELIEPV